MTSFFYVVSIAYHTSVPVLRKCMDTSRRKKTFGWERSHSCTACCTSSSDLKDLPPIASLNGPKTWKSLGARSGEYGGCGRHSKDRSWIVAAVERAVWGQDWHVATKHLYSEVRVVLTWLQDADDSLGDLHTLHCSQCSPWACSAPRLPLVHPKRESAYPFPVCLTRSRRVCYRTSAVHELPSPLVHLL